MGQSASRRRAAAQPQPQQDEPQAPRRPSRPRTLRNSLLSLMSSSASDGNSSRRVSRRWSRAPPPKPEPAHEDGPQEEVVPDPREPERPRTPLPATTTTVTPPQPPDPIRGFPPPGTLVIVQGVVHTTDILRPPTPSTTPAISNSSIDVLGTLLTVAAQATAASLLSGSTLPTDTASPNTPQPPRRTPWSALRERLGPTSLPALPPPTNAPTVGDERARMLAEMARAFNVGLGLSPPNAAQDENSSTPSIPIPEEGTFDRFLVDLQTDLRVALAPRSSTSLESTPEEVESPSLEPPEAPSNDPTPVLDSPPASAATSLDPVLVPPADPTDAAPTTPPIPPRAGTGPGAVNWWRVYRFPSIPVVLRDTDTSAEAGANPTSLDQQTTTSEEQQPSSETPSTTPPESTAATPAPRTVVPVIVVGLQSVQLGAGQPFPGTAMHSDGPGQSEGIHGVIPMHPPAGDAPAPLPFSGDVVSAEVPANEPANEPEASTEGSTSRGRSWWRPRAPSSSTEAASGSAVVVDEAVADMDVDTTVVNEDDDAEEEEEEEEAESEDDDDETREDSSDSHSSPPTAESSDTSQPQAAAASPPASDASRTFLIYVIGGYYPPEHGILTNGGMPESFEALLELSELLGNMRPPTASKADIARAGLAVVKRDALEGLSVTANCTEKCLICLDDYTETDPIRVLNCRHAFHQGCVDQWLETGRNNCPACRTRGVPTEPGPGPGVGVGVGAGVGGPQQQQQQQQA
ncbi:hypothetical protein C8F01DRAFT_1100821 [Mycena amicta]|nr:hypothetical protein C8F01DRAFT_1100821 [Mycena amicta]